jgi:hypothetical protein
MQYGGAVTIAIAVGFAAVLILALLGFRRGRQTQPEGALGRVSQSWLMERRSDGRDRFS